MRDLSAGLRAVLLRALVSVLLMSTAQSQSAVVIPVQLRQFVDSRIVQGVDIAATHPRLIAGDKFNKAPRALQLRATMLARAYVRDVRPDATTMVIVDASGKMIETLSVNH